MRTNEISKRYAKALLALVKQTGLHTNTYSELHSILGVFQKDPSVKEYFENPIVSLSQKVAALKAALSDKGISEEVKNTLLLMTEKNRIQHLPDMIEAFLGYLDIEEGITRGVVKSAQPLSADSKKELEAKVSSVLKKKIVLTYQQDPKLLGGAVAQVGGWTFDDSIETHLKKMNEELNRRAN